MAKSERTKELERLLRESTEQDYLDYRSEREAEEAEKRAKEERRRAKESARIQEIKDQFNWASEGEFEWFAVDLESDGSATICSYFRDNKHDSMEFIKSEWENLKYYMSGLH